MNDLYRLKNEFPWITRKIFKEFIDTHYTDFLLEGELDMTIEFPEWYDMNFGRFETIQ
tara:strand:- start:324 stop:497 length:174 start_codon:yes stop_codon:yes gene_type:complete